MGQLINMDKLKEIYKAHCLLFKVLAWVGDSLSMLLWGAVATFSSWVASVPLPDGSTWAKDVVLMAGAFWLFARGGHYCVKIYNKLK